MSKKKWFLGIGIILFLGIIAGSVWLLPHYKMIKKDLARLDCESYDTVFFSMYSTEYYAEEDYAHFRGMQIVRTDYEIPNDRILQVYINKVKESSNTVTTVYLGIDPAKASVEDISCMIQENPEMTFEVVLSYPRISYWTEMKEAEYTEVLEKYRSFAEGMLSLANARVYLFAGEEWLICNRENYVDVFTTNAEVSLFLMCNSDFLHPYMCRPETLEADFSEMKTLIDFYRVTAQESMRGEGYDIVFFGDSIIGNYTDSMSIPGVVKALTGASVYNCGYGGSSAAMGEENTCPIPVIVDALIEGEVSVLPKEAQVYEGVNEFLSRDDKGKKLMFVINYGLNDYFKGYPAQTEDMQDIYSYKGAMRMAVESLKDAYPEAEILLMTPNFTTYYGYGREVQSEKGGVLTDYVAAVLELAQEQEVGVLDNFNELPITEENWPEYLSDGCHMTEKCRFLVGRRIAERIE